MRCPNPDCGYHGNRPQAKFCAECATSLPVRPSTPPTITSSITTGDVGEGATVAATLIRRVKRVEAAEVHVWHSIIQPPVRQDPHQIREPIADFVGRRIAFDQLAKALKEHTKAHGRCHLRPRRTWQG